jgi:hypothetical protein
MKNKKKHFKAETTTTTITALPTTTTATRGVNSGNRSAIVASGINGFVVKIFVTHFRVIPVLNWHTPRARAYESN